jgi:hypothetical protein
MAARIDGTSSSGSAKKAARRKARRAEDSEQKLIERVNPGLGNKYSKEKLRAELSGKKGVVKGREAGDSGKAYTKSTKFFAKLQEEVTAHGGRYSSGLERKKAAEEAGKPKPAALKL